MEIDTTPLEPVPLPEPPPEVRLPPGQWIRQNLFSNAFNSVLTVIFATGIAVALFRGIRFIFVTGRWDILRVNLTNYMVGIFPRDQLWRPWAAIYLLVAVIGIRWGVGVAQRLAESEARGEGQQSLSLREPLRRVWPLALLALVLIVLSFEPVTIASILGLAFTAGVGRAVGIRLPRVVVRWTPVILIAGIIIAFEVIVGFGGVGVRNWRGLLLTIFLSVGGIVLSFPLGVLLALGRRSTFPVFRLLSVVYIELIRGVPLITLLFMGAFVIGFMYPPGSTPPSPVTRALIAFVLFTAAYVAEIVRGGLQSVPKGQIEAAQAVGLSPARVTVFIVLPQALRNVIPAMVGQFISLFKDTSLAGFIGLTELLETARNVSGQPEFRGQGLQAESLLFASLIYWTGAYWMSKSSQRLEARLGVGER